MISCIWSVPYLRYWIILDHYVVDREVEQLVRYLEDSGEIDNTMIIFTSDNGYMIGEHQTRGKFAPWRKSVQVPLIISWPGHVAENTTNHSLVSQVDISRTILDVAGVDTSELELDGHNIFDESRTNLFMEYFFDPVSNGGRIETWASIRTPTYQYTEWYNMNDESQVSLREFYDMVNDPYQLNNLYRNDDPNDDPDFTQLSISLANQRTCSGVTCVSAEVPNIIGQGVLDSEEIIGPRYVRLGFDSLVDAHHSITVNWDSDAYVRFNVFEIDGTKISSNVVQGSNPGVWTGELKANERYYIGLWSANGVANFTATVEVNGPD